MIIPEAQISNIIHIHGDKGQQWLHDLPDLLQQFAKSWNLILGDCARNRRPKVCLRSCTRIGKPVIARAFFHARLRMWCTRDFPSRTVNINTGLRKI